MGSQFEFLKYYSAFYLIVVTLDKLGIIALLLFFLIINSKINWVSQINKHLIILAISVFGFITRL